MPVLFLLRGKGKIERQNTKDGKVGRNMYKLVIADDEKNIRDSLMKLVDWESLGFEVVFLADDGTKVIEFLKEHRADVVFTDIKMRQCSGMEVAKYVFEQSLPVKVVLLSGYQEFEFARNAISYNVQEYLLKPVSLAEIQECFRKIRKVLDSEQQERQNLSSIEKGILEKLFEMIQLGGIREAEAVDNYLNSFGEGKNFQRFYISEIKLYINKQKEYDEFLYDVLKHALDLYQEKFGLSYILMFLREKKDSYRLIGISEFLPEESVFSSILTDISTTFEMEISCETVSQWKKWETYFKERSWKNPMGKEHLISVAARQLLMILHMSEDMKNTADELYKNWFENTEKRSKDELQLMEKLFEEMQRQQKGEIKSFKRPEFREKPEDYFRREILEFYMAINREDDRNSIVSRIQKLLKEKISENVSLKEAADTVFLSPNYFSKVFKEQSGENYSDFSIRMKMERAAELLESPEYKVYEVSELLGYSNLKYFYKVFKRIWGRTPKEYRREKGEHSRVETMESIGLSEK